MKRLLTLSVAALALGATPLAAQDIAITGATLASGDGSAPVENATVVVRGGRVVDAGSGVAVPGGVPVVDGEGMWVTPGLFASITNLGLVDVGAVSESNDVDADEAPFHAALDVSPAVNPQSQEVGYSRAGGVTRASVSPGAGSAIFAGQGAVIDLGADFDAVRQRRAFQVVEMGERGAALAGGSRTAVHAMVRTDFSSFLEHAEHAADAAGDSAREHRNLLVMVVDDSVTVRKVTSRFLERNGMDVLLAKDGVDAIQLLQEHSPDVMLLDIEMPRMDGFEVAARVKHSSRLKNLPIIMITSRTGDKHRERAHALGVDRYLGKPYQEIELLRNIEELAGVLA